MSMSSRCVNKPMDCSLSTGLTVLTWSASTFSSAFLFWSERLTDTGEQLENKSHCSFFGALAVTLETFSISWTIEPDCCSDRAGLPVLTNWIFGLWLGLLGVLTTSCNFWTQFSHPIVFKRKSLEEVEVTHILSRIWLLQIPSWYPSVHNKLEACRKGWLRSIVFDRTWIFSSEQD